MNRKSRTFKWILGEIRATVYLLLIYTVLDVNFQILCTREILEYYIKILETHR